MNALTMILATAGLAVFLYEMLGLLSFVIGYSDPPPPSGFLQDIRHRSVIWALLGAGLLASALLLRRRLKRLNRLLIDASSRPGTCCPRLVLTRNRRQA